MIFTIIDLIILFIACRRYNKYNYVFPVWALAYFASDAFLINLGMPPIVKHKDIGLLLLAYCCYLGYKRNPHFFSKNGDGSTKIILIFLGFIGVEFAYSMIEKVDSISNIVAVLRDFLYLASFFVFREIPKNQYWPIAKKILLFILLSCILYMLMFFTHIPFLTSFVGRVDDFYRIQITPSYIELAFLCLFFIPSKYKHKKKLLLLIPVVLLLSLNRTAIIGLIVAVVLLSIFSTNSKHKVLYLILISLAYPFINIVMEYRDSNASDSQKISLDETVRMIKNEDFKSLSRTNTFAFRLALVSERIDYLLENPEKLVLGVGAIHEDSNSASQFDFSVGTIKHNNSLEVEIGQVSSIDTTWSLVLRYGFAGFVIFLFFLIASAKLLYDCRSDEIMFIGWALIISNILQSISVGIFFWPYWLIQYAALHAYRYSLRNNAY